MKPHINPCICDTCLAARDKELARVRQSVKAEERAKILKEIEGKKKVKLTNKETLLNKIIGDYLVGYNQALQDIAELIKPKKLKGRK